MEFDLARARQDTPACEKVLHFNNAGASLMPLPVLEATLNHLQLEAAIGGYEAEAQNHDKVERFYGATAALLNCQPHEVAFIENATRAWDMAFYSIPFKAGDRILTGMNEYASNYIAFMQLARKTGAVVEVIPNDEFGQISVAALRQAMDDKVKLIAITHVPTNGGLVNPAEAVGQVAREAGCLFLLDACQSVGQYPLDIVAIGCDFLSATGRKYLRGPRGTGLLYVRGTLIEQLEPPFLDLHAATWVAKDRYEISKDAHRFENWECNFAGKIGLGVAIDYALSWGISAIWQRVTSLAEQLRTNLQELPGVTVRDLGVERCGIVTFTVQDKAANEIKAALADHQINVTVSTTSSTRFDMEARGLSEVIRASVHYYNSEAEIERFCHILPGI